MGSARRILIVGPSWVGDMVMAQSLFMTLKQADPCDIDVLAPPWSLPMLERMPEVRRGIALPLGHGELGLGVRRRIGRALTGEGYDQAIVLPGSLKSALVPWFAGIPRRTAFRGEMRYGLVNDMRPLDKQALPMTVQRFITLGLEKGRPLPDPLPYPHLRADPDNQRRLCDTFSLTADRPSIAFMPGAEYGPAKQWPLAHFAETGRRLADSGFQIWILGSAKDAPAADVIRDTAGGGRIINLCGQTELADAVDLLAMCRAAVTNDSGLMHVAAALDIPLVAIYGSSTPDHTPPLARHIAVSYLRLSCSPCFKRVCPLGHTRCLHDITPDSVMRALATLGIADTAADAAPFIRAFPDR